MNEILKINYETENPNYKQEKEDYDKAFEDYKRDLAIYEKTEAAEQSKMSKLYDREKDLIEMLLKKHKIEG